MDDLLLHPDVLHSLSTLQLLSLSISLPRSSPKTFSLLTLTLVFPLSFAILAHSLLTHPLLLRIQTLHHPSRHDFSLLLLFQLLYLLLLFSFSLLSTAAFVFSVASLYSRSSSLSFSLSLSALPPILPRLLRTFLWISLLLLLYNLLFLLSLFLLLLLQPSFSLLSLSLLSLALFLSHVYLSALWHLASVVSVLEPVCGLSALSRARVLLRGRTRTAASLVSLYLALCGLVGALFRAAVIAGPDEEFSLGIRSVPARALLGAVLVAVLVVANLTGLLVQSVFYYVCKSYHGQGIDREALSDHLGGYLGEYVPLKSSIQMESL